jgi:site-specific DNA recombinase
LPEARGVRSCGRKVFSPEHLRSLAVTDAYRAKRTHRGTLTDAAWPAIVPERQWLAVKRRLSDPARVTTKPGGAKHLLSMIARCDVCSGPMTVRVRRGLREYRCQDHSHLHVSAGDLDACATAAILAYLTRPDNVERLVPPTPPTSDSKASGPRSPVSAPNWTTSPTMSVEERCPPASRPGRGPAC